MTSRAHDSMARPWRGFEITLFCCFLGSCAHFDGTTCFVPIHNSNTELAFRFGLAACGRSFLT